MYIQIHSNQIRRISDTEYRVQLPKSSLYPQYTFVLPKSCITWLPLRTVHKANVRIELVKDTYTISSRSKKRSKSLQVTASEIQQAFQITNQELLHPFNTGKVDLDDVW